MRPLALEQARRAVPHTAFPVRPASMACNLQAGFRQAGIASRHIHREYLA
jgi:hypothetical protein